VADVRSVRVCVKEEADRGRAGAKATAVRVKWGRMVCIGRVLVRVCGCMARKGVRADVLSVDYGARLGGVCDLGLPPDDCVRLKGDANTVSGFKAMRLGTGGELKGEACGVSGQKETAGLLEPAGARLSPKGGLRTGLRWRRFRYGRRPARSTRFWPNLRDCARALFLP
jgi:hypothetical protein